jgi:hypothetical protein
MARRLVLSAIKNRAFAARCWSARTGREKGMQPTDFTGPLANKPVPDTTEDSPAPYATPLLERIGTWQALTLQQSVPITGFRNETDTGRGARYGEG